MKYFQAPQMEYEKNAQNADSQRKIHKYSKSTIPAAMQKSQFIVEKKSFVPSPEQPPIMKKWYPAVNKTTHPTGVLHKKSASTVQGIGYPGAGKASEILAHITAKYSIPYKKTDFPKSMSKPSATLIQDGSELHSTIRDLLRHDPSITLESLINSTTKAQQTLARPGKPCNLI